MLFSREIVCQRRCRCLATGLAGVDQLSDYLQSVKKDVNQAKNPLSLTAVQFGVHKSTDGRTTATADAISLSYKGASATPNQSE